MRPLTEQHQGFTHWLSRCTLQKSRDKAGLQQSEAALESRVVMNLMGGLAGPVRWILRTQKAPHTSILAVWSRKRRYGRPGSPVPVLGLVLRPYQEAHEEQVDDDVCWERPVRHVHVGGDGRYEVRQHCTQRSRLPYSVRTASSVVHATSSPGARLYRTTCPRSANLRGTLFAMYESTGKKPPADDR